MTDPTFADFLQPAELDFYPLGGEQIGFEHSLAAMRMALPEVKSRKVAAIAQIFIEGLHRIS